MKVLLTGGTGFVAVHCLEALFRHGHEVVTTVRSPEKGEALLRLFKGKALSYRVVEDIAKVSAFDEVVKSNPPLEAVIHTASPFHYKAEDNKRDMLDPAINGTVGILNAVQKVGHGVTRVVITSSFAALSNSKNPPDTYNEDSWNPITMEDALTTSNTQAAYSASKKFAERAAWDFVEREKPTWTLTVLNPTMIYGPVLQPGVDLNSLNTSSRRILDIYQGATNNGPTGSPMYVDVRDLAEAHVLALEIPEAANQRFFMVAGMGTEKAMADIMKKSFPDLTKTIRSDLSDSVPSYKVDNSKSKKLLHINYRSLEETIVDTVKSLQALGA